MAEDRHDHMEPTLTPKALILRLMPGPSPADWEVTRRYSDRLPTPVQMPSSQRIPAPWGRTPSFWQTLAGFWRLSRQALTEASDLDRLHTHAVALGDELAHVLTDQDRVYLSTPGAATPFLTIESADPAILALPWELLRLQDEFAVREGLLDVARSVWIDDAPELTPPSAPATLVMSVAAPEPSSLDEGAERYRLLRAIPAPITPVLNETGEFEELLASVSAAPPIFGIHFSGQASDGQLRFEDSAGQGRSIPVENLQQALRTTAPERQPRFFFLALDYDVASVSQGSEELPWLTRISTAHKLHQAGIPQVVVHDRAIADPASPVVEPAVWATLYAAVARGQSTRDAVRAARHILTTPRGAPAPLVELGAAPAASHEVPPYAWTQLLYFHRGREHPLGLPEAQFDGGIHLPKHQVANALLGRRKALHDFRRMRQTQGDITVVQGPAGIGKTAFCYDAQHLYKRLGYVVLILRCGAVEFDPQPLNTLLWQCTQAASQVAGAQWPALCAVMDESVVDQLKMPSPAARLLMLLQVLMQRPGHPRLVLYLDNLESLMSRPPKGGTARHWRHAEVAELWHALVQSAQESHGQLAVLASCRYTHADLQPYLLPLRPLVPDAVWSLLSHLPGLQNLMPDNRHRLLKRINGHPQAAILLDALLSHRLVDSDAAQPTPHTARDEWRQVVAPILPTQNRPLSERLLFKAIWDHPDSIGLRGNALSLPRYAC
uniref:AAA family ATPase n=1 Tax=Candidatus Entotheonella palauensis TaxID=93172 RepID=UPI0011782345